MVASAIRKDTLVRYKRAKKSSGRILLEVALMNGEEGLVFMGDLGKATQVDVPATINGLIEMDGVLVHVEEKCIQHMGAVLPLTEPAHILPKTETKVNKYLKWYHEEVSVTLCVRGAHLLGIPLIATKPSHILTAYAII